MGVFNFLMLKGNTTFFGGKKGGGSKNSKMSEGTSGPSHNPSSALRYSMWSEMHKKCMHVSFFHYVTLVWIIITHKYQFDDVGQPLPPPPFPVGSILSKIYLHIYLRIVATYCRASVRLENVVLDLVKPHLYITVSLPIIYKVVDEFINIKRMSRKSIDMQLQYFADCLDTYMWYDFEWL